MPNLRLEIETCPCSVCRSDMAYIIPCESPVVIIPTMVVVDLTPQNKTIQELVDAAKKPVGITASGGHGKRTKLAANKSSKPSPFKIDEGTTTP